MFCLYIVMYDIFIMLINVLIYQFLVLEIEKINVVVCDLDFRIVIFVYFQQFFFDYLYIFYSIIRIISSFIDFMFFRKKYDIDMLDI